MNKKEDHFEWSREVSRVSHELQTQHGLAAYKYAAKLAARALAEAKLDDHQFWKDVEASLTPREI
jgi:hypothetical protein